MVLRIVCFFCKFLPKDSSLCNECSIISEKQAQANLEALLAKNQIGPPQLNERREECDIQPQGQTIKQNKLEASAESDYSCRLPSSLIYRSDSGKKIQQFLEMVCCLYKGNYYQCQSEELNNNQPDNFVAEASESAEYYQIELNKNQQKRKNPLLRLITSLLAKSNNDNRLEEIIVKAEEKFEQDMLSKQWEMGYGYWIHQIGEEELEIKIPKVPIFDFVKDFTRLKRGIDVNKYIKERLRTGNHLYALTTGTVTMRKKKDTGYQISFYPPLYLVAAIERSIPTAYHGATLMQYTKKLAEELVRSAYYNYKIFNRHPELKKYRKIFEKLYSKIIVYPYYRGAAINELEIPLLINEEKKKELEKSLKEWADVCPPLGETEFPDYDVIEAYKGLREWIEQNKRYMKEIGQEKGLFISIAQANFKTSDIKALMEVYEEGVEIVNDLKKYLHSAVFLTIHVGKEPIPLDIEKLYKLANKNEKILFPVYDIAPSRGIDKIYVYNRIFNNISRKLGGKKRGSVKW